MGMEVGNAYLLSKICATDRTNVSYDHKFHTSSVKDVDAKWLYVILTQSYRKIHDGEIDFIPLKTRYKQTNKRFSFWLVAL